MRSSQDQFATIESTDGFLIKFGNFLLQAALAITFNAFHGANAQNTFVGDMPRPFARFRREVLRGRGQTVKIRFARS